MHHSIIPSLQYSGLSTYEPWTRTWRDTRLPRFGYTHRVSIVDIRSLARHPDSVGCWCVCARLARTQSPAATALRALAPDCIPSRPPHALSRAGIASTSVGRTAVAVSHDPTSAANDGGAAAATSRRSTVAAVARPAAACVAAWAQPLVLI